MPEPSRSLLRHPDFLKLWTAETISVFGVVDHPARAAADRRDRPRGERRSSSGCSRRSSSCRSSCSACRPACGWTACGAARSSSRATSGRAVAIASIPVAFHFDALTIWQLYVVGFVNGCLTVFFDVAYQSYLPSVVERDQLVEGNSKLEITRSARADPGAGHRPACSSASCRRRSRCCSTRCRYAVSAVFLFWIRRPEPPRRAARRGGPRPEAVDARRRSRRACAT